MNVTNINPIIALTIAIISLLVSIGSLVISGKMLKATEKRINLELEKWKNDRVDNKEQARLEFIRDLYNGFSNHNWRFIQHWPFPGVFPKLSDMNDSIPDKSKENKKLFGERVVALEHINILLRVFTNKDILKPQDIQGFTNWANNWYEGSKEALRTIFKSGDTYPLDFIVWLRDIIFRQQYDFQKFFGQELKKRLDLFEPPAIPLNNKGGRNENSN
jgi:hypothetical protein